MNPALFQEMIREAAKQQKPAKEMPKPAAPKKKK